MAKRRSTSANGSAGLYDPRPMRNTTTALSRIPTPLLLPILPIAPMGFILFLGN